MTLFVSDIGPCKRWTSESSTPSNFQTYDLVQIPTESLRVIQQRAPFLVTACLNRCMASPRAAPVPLNFLRDPDELAQLRMRTNERPGMPASQEPIIGLQLFDVGSNFIEQKGSSYRSRCEHHRDPIPSSKRRYMPENWFRELFSVM